MGTFASTVHVYTDTPLPNELGSFSCFSEGWQTMLPRDEENFEQDRKIARRLSKQLALPVLWFWEFDSDEYGFVLFSDGKQRTVFSTESLSEPKGLYQLPPLIDYPTGNKQRLSKILSCADMECSIAMLEEYFGVCLEVFPELLKTPEALKRTRSEEKYRAYLAEEKRFSGKNAPIGAELTKELFGKVEYEPVFGDFHIRRRISSTSRSSIPTKKERLRFPRSNFAAASCCPRMKPRYAPQRLPYAEPAVKTADINWSFIQRRRSRLPTTRRRPSVARCSPRSRGDTILTISIFPTV